MTEQPSEDPLNAILLDARKELQDLRSSLHQPNVDYSQVLHQLSDATTKYKNEADTIVADRFTESNLLPIQVPIPKRSLIQQIRSSSPKEIHPFKTNRAMELRKKYARPTHFLQPIIPPLKPYHEGLSINDLIQKGVISSYDNINSLMPSVTPGAVDPSEAPLFGSLKIDISGAARAHQQRKTKQREANEKLNNELISEATVLPNTPYTVVTDTVRENSPASKEESTRVTQESVRSSSQGPRVYEDLQDEFAYQTLLVVRGKIARETPDFESFQRTNTKIWNKIDSVLHKIEEFCRVYGIQFAEIDGRKLSEAASLSIITWDDVHRCLVNVDEFVKSKKNEKAALIQKNVRIWLERTRVGKIKRQHQAAYKIQTWWRGILRKKAIPERNIERNEEIIAKACELADAFRSDDDSAMHSLETSEIVITNIIASPQDLTRTFSLMYNNTTVILVLDELPPPHIWEDIIEYFAQCGIPDVNERIHFIQLRPMNSGDGISHRLQCDMKAVQRIRRILQGRNGFILPHADWFSEHRLSSDINLPIFGLVDTSDFQSRGRIKEIFSEARVVTPYSTSEYRSVGELISDGQRLMRENREETRFLIRYGFAQSESSVAWFDATPELIKSSDKACELLVQQMNCAGVTANEYLKMIESVGGMIEAMPSVIHSFPSVALLLSGDKKMKVIGTFDRIHHTPYRFAGAIVPSCSVNPNELMSQAKMVGGILMKRNVMGYVIIDFVSYKEDNEVKLLGYDIRLNAYPYILFNTYMTLCSDFNPNTGKMVVLKNIGDPTVKPVRYAVVQNAVTHPGMGMFSMKEIRKTCYGQGMFFDLLNRTGFKIQFFETPSKGKNFALTSALSAPTALQLMEKTYSYLVKVFGQKVGSDTGSSMANCLHGVRRFMERVFPQ